MKVKYYIFNPAGTWPVNNTFAKNSNFKIKNKPL